MKKILITLFFIFSLFNNSFSKTLDLGMHTLEVPNKFYLINWSNSSMNGQINLCTEEFDNCFGIVDKKLKEVINRLENGESYENIKILKPLISSLNKQDSNCIELDNGMCKGSVQRFWSKLKSYPKVKFPFLNDDAPTKSDNFSSILPTLFIFLFSLSLII